AISTPPSANASGSQTRPPFSSTATTPRPHASPQNGRGKQDSPSWPISISSTPPSTHYCRESITSSPATISPAALLVNRTSRKPSSLCKGSSRTGSLLQLSV